MSLAIFRPKLCKMGFHDETTATFVGIGDLEITGKKNHPPLLLRGDYRVLKCVCGETFTTGLEKKEEARA